MTREELVALRADLQTEVEARRLLSDYDANAAGIRRALEANLKLTQHLIDRMPRKK